MQNAGILNQRIKRREPKSREKRKGVRPSTASKKILSIAICYLLLMVTDLRCVCLSFIGIVFLHSNFTWRDAFCKLGGGLDSHAPCFAFTSNTHLLLNIPLYFAISKFNHSISIFQHYFHIKISFKIK